MLINILWCNFVLSIGSNEIMSLEQLYKSFPSQIDCIIHLEKVRWLEIPTCPYCKSIKQTPSKKEKRYHCNTCNTSYSVKVGTLFEDTKLDLQKWFFTIVLIIDSKKSISSRKLAREIHVTKDTALFMIHRVRKAIIDFNEFLYRLIRMTEKVVSES